METPVEIEGRDGRQGGTQPGGADRVYRIHRIDSVVERTKFKEDRLGEEPQAKPYVGCDSEADGGVTSQVEGVQKASDQSKLMEHT
jgi:hypothetical protein